MDPLSVLEQVWWLGIPTALIIGIMLALNPLALPILGTAVALGSTGEVGAKGAGVRVTAAFGAGMVVVYTLVGVVASRVDAVTNGILRPYAGIGYVVLATVLLALGLFLLSRPASFCAACALPVKRNPTVLGAFLAGIPGGFVNCPACAGIVLGVASSSATLGSPLYSGAVMLALGAGHAAVLTGLVWLITSKRSPSPRLLRVLRRGAGVLLVGLAVYFFWLAQLQGLRPGPRLT